MSAAFPQKSTSPHMDSKKEDKVHEFHCYGNLQLRSTDNIIFKVNSERLASVSAVFKDMLEIGDESTPTGSKRKSAPDSEMIDFGFPSSTLEILLDMMNVPKPSIPYIYFPSALNLYECCEKYDISTKIRDLVKGRVVETATGGYQWALLLWSHKSNDMELTRCALKSMDNLSFLHPQILKENNIATHLNFWSAMLELPMEWRWELLRLSFCVTSGFGNGISINNWSHVANAFNPQQSS